MSPLRQCFSSRQRGKAGIEKNKGRTQGTFLLRPTLVFLYPYIPFGLYLVMRRIGLPPANWGR